MAEGGLTRRTFVGGAAAAAASAALPRGAKAASAEPSEATAAVSGSTTLPRSVDVVIVGGGLAGLTAAREVVKAGHTALVLEARTRVGGRTLNHDLGPQGFPGRVIEVGGQWIGPIPGEPATATFPTQAIYKPQEKLYELAQALAVGTYKTYNLGEYVDFSSVSGRTTYSSSTRIPTDPGTANAGSALFQLNEMAKQVSTESPWTATSAAEWDALTFETWMRENLSPKNQPPGSPSNSLINLAIESVFAAEPRDLSLLHVLFYTAAAGTLDNLVDTTNGAQDSRFIGGSQQVSIELAAKLGGVVALGRPVRIVKHTAKSVIAQGTGFRVAAKRAIVAIPPTLAGRIVYAPTLAELSGDGGLREQLTQRVPMGTTIKVQCVYEHPFWRESGLAGQATSDTGPVKITFDNTPYPDPGTAAASPGVLIGFIEGADARVWGTKTRAERYAAVVECFVRYFGSSAKNVLGGENGYIEMLWAQEEFTGGCYGGIFPTGVWTSYGEALRAPVGRVNWAGTETATAWNGYMDGAVRSGERAAAEALAAL